ncbi:PTS glucitol/sorbitol transporter subunit IIA [Erwinia sorbitola]|uniref:PTS glucitol/sorbitol transporter subunit IIA n=1 Tax=Erwinia sorbitola TaxID=2681984 RepID=A0A6I6EE10_9GAMM|nr:PTS glucitol/sorbitol transporter subunit IIA [Erwinia sorbitola]MTD25338.1 PTS glucitol/sorbitol transporter subunit IIA [Erwinia sorbitola]QGU88087.1 PTS glucitol/sorbitol transporter subunit IIA [Erwinia sorbitola]
MKTVYESTFIAVGGCAGEALDDHFLITFGEGAPGDVADYCFIHRPEVRGTAPLVAGTVITIGEYSWPVTAVGEVAELNLRELGHITVKFDGATAAEFPGTVHVAGLTPAGIEPGQKFRVLSH